MTNALEVARQMQEKRLEPIKELLEAEEGRKTAQEALDEANANVARLVKKAQSAGWTPNELKQIGFTTQRKRRKKTVEDNATPPSGVTQKPAEDRE